MKTIAEERSMLLSEMGASKNSLGLSLEEIRSIDSALSTRWGINFFHTDLKLWELVAATVDEQTAKRYIELAHKEDAIYREMTSPELLGIVTSTRRHILIDSVALAVTLIRRTGISGAILDVGCHAGVVPDLLADLVANEITGIDPVSPAILAAKTKLSYRSSLKFEVARMPWNTEQRFEFLVAVDSMPGKANERLKFLEGIASVMLDGGVALIISRNWQEFGGPKACQSVEDLGLGFGLADVVGGYGGAPTIYGADGCVALVKGSKNKFPRAFLEEMGSDWSSFSKYSNSLGTRADEKTLAYKRAYAKTGLLA